MEGRRCEETFRVRAFGPLACFTRPEFKVERVSYEIMTPSAARGLLEAVHWKPAIRWVVTAVHVLRPVRFVSFKRNEVSKRASTDEAKRGMRGEPVAQLYADDERQQRNTVALRNVEYVVEAYFVATARWGPDDTFAKHAAMFRRRLEDGQTYHQPYFGCREFAAAVEPAPAAWKTAIPADELPRCLGLVLHDIEFGAMNRPRFFQARIDEAGRVVVPPFAEAVALTTGGES